MIKIINGCKRYKSKILLNNFNFKINENDFISFIGLNGSGKTTLAEIVLGIKKLDKGKISFISNKIIKKGAVFQDSGFNPFLNISQILKFFKKLNGIKDLNIKTILKKYDLIDEAKTKYKNLSAGQKQKFKLAQALMNEPNVLILDEISTSLDYIWKQRIIQLIKNYLRHNRCMVILVSHNFDEVIELSNRVYFFQKNANPREILFKNKEDLSKKLQKFILI